MQKTGKSHHLTYSLDTDNLDSNKYYSDVREFTDNVIEYASHCLKGNIEEFMVFINKNNPEEQRTQEEYLLELLSFGILWRSWGGYAMASRFVPYRFMAWMAQCRKRHQRLKPHIDRLRGVMATLFLLPARKKRNTDRLPSFGDMDRFFKWLKATGEFREQALRFQVWRKYWDSMPYSRWLKGRQTVFDFVDWFVINSKQSLGQYTEGVNGFLADSENRYRWKENRVQCTRTEPEYHLNMVGAEIMNRAFRNDFLSAHSRALLLPGCMRAVPREQCKAIRLTEGLQCQGCKSSCNVNVLREQGTVKGFDVYIIPHASDLSLWAPTKGKPTRAVIAVACVTTLVEGGWELKRYGAFAQCVLLNFSGCKKHWQSHEMPTCFNINELHRILATP